MHSRFSDSSLVFLWFAVGRVAVMLTMLVVVVVSRPTD